MPPLALEEIVLRLALALAAGAVIGLNRDLHGKRAGLRTFGLVALSISGLTIGMTAAFGHAPDAVSRVVQGVLTGIGFLGAGVIFRKPEAKHVSGLTTAAAVWFTAALSILCGLGTYWLASALLALGLALLLVGRPVERAVERLFGRDADDDGRGGRDDG